MSITVNQAPTASAWYAKNTVPKLILTANENASVTVLWKDQTAGSWSTDNQVFAGSYAPDMNNKITVDFTGLFDAFLATTIPAHNATVELQDKGWYYFKVIVNDSNGTQVTERVFQVMNATWGMVVSFGAWTGDNFLTNQPKEKPTTYDSMEWLTYMDRQGDHYIKACFYLKAGDFEDFVLRTDTAIGMYTINVSYPILAANLLTPVSDLEGYYDVIHYDSKDTELARQRYIFKTRCGREHYYMIANALGGVDTLICDGANTLQPDVTHNIGRFNDLYTELNDTDDRRQWQQLTGKMPVKWRNWLHELFSAKQGAAIHNVGTINTAIVITGSELAISDNGQVGEAAFTYILDKTVNAISYPEYNDDRMLHQSVADHADPLEPLPVVES